MLEVRDADAVPDVDRVAEAGILDHREHALRERPGGDAGPQRAGGVVERPPRDGIQARVARARRPQRPAEARVAPVAGQAGDEVADDRIARGRPRREFGLAPVPGGAGILGVWYWAIPAAATQVDEAWAFIRWIASRAANAERVGRGGSPVRTSTMTDPRVWERGYGRDYYEAVNAIHRKARPLVSGPNAEEAIRSLGEAVHGTITGEMGVDDAIARAARQVAELLGAQGLAGRLVTEHREELGGCANRERPGEPEDVPVAGHQDRALRLGQCDEIVVAGVRRATWCGNRIVCEVAARPQQLDELGGLCRRDTAAKLRVAERAFELDDHQIGHDELERARTPPRDDLRRHAPGRQDGGDQDVRVEDGAHSALRRACLVLRFDGQLVRLVRREIVAGPEAVQKVEAELAPECVLDDLAVALPTARGADLDGAKDAFVDGERRSHLCHNHIIAS